MTLDWSVIHHHPCVMGIRIELHTSFSESNAFISFIANFKIFVRTRTSIDKRSIDIKGLYIQALLSLLTWSFLVTSGQNLFIIMPSVCLYILSTSVLNQYLRTVVLVFVVILLLSKISKILTISTSTSRTWSVLYYEIRDWI